MEMYMKVEIPKEREVNTDEIVNFFKEKKLISKLIPTVQQKLFTTIDENELEQLKQSIAKTKLATNQRNSLILDFLFYTGIRVGELVNIRHCDYQNKILKIHGKGNKIRYIPILDSLAKHFSGSSDYLFRTWKGHSNLQTTANYIHNSYEELRQEY
ncbi:1797_t:CDS:2, partial [Gigaspora margarita]